MTTPNTPATRARELFDKLASDIYSRQGLGDEWQAIDDTVMNDELMPDWLVIFSAALARERREAFNSAIELVRTYASATPIAEALERFRDGEKG